MHEDDLLLTRTRRFQYREFRRATAKGILLVPEARHYTDIRHKFGWTDEAGNELTWDFHRQNRKWLFTDAGKVFSYNPKF